VGRRERVGFADLTEVEAVSLRTRLFVTRWVGESLLLVTNAYADLASLQGTDFVVLVMEPTPRREAITGHEVPDGAARITQLFSTEHFERYPRFEKAHVGCCPWNQLRGAVTASRCGIC
jgi:hypothetical protein